MSRYRAYPEYKDSGVEWLPQVPERWGVVQLRRSLLEHKQGYYTTADYVDDGVKLVRITDLSGFGEIDFRDCPKVPSSDPNLKIFELKDGDVVFARTGGAGIFGVVESLPERAIFASYLIRFRFCKNWLDKRYTKFVFMADFFQESVKQNIHGGVNQNIHAEDIKGTYLAIPPLREQEKIAAFLCHEIAKIDALIEKQQRLIELLKEKRQAVISHAVTKGLNPNASMKDSGLEWLGEVPAHWKICALKHPLKSLDNRRIPLSGEERSTRQGEYRYYGASGVIDHIDEYIFDEPTILVGEDGANLVNRSTPLAFSAHGKYWVNNHAHILKAEDGLADFWAEAIEHIDINPLVSGSAQPKLTAENLNNLKIAFPLSTSERKEISDFIEGRKVEFKRLIDKAEAQISLLQERRTALISAAVTGKIDVRDWQVVAEQEAWNAPQTYPDLYFKP